MKKLIFISFLPIAGIAWLGTRHNPSTTLVEVRSGTWPISLEKSDTAYFLQFRDQQVTNGEMLDTLPFRNLTELKYFGQALTVLKTGHNGDIAQFEHYSIKRAESKLQGTWYILRIKWGLTNFQQPEADIMIKAIQGL